MILVAGELQSCDNFPFAKAYNSASSQAYLSVILILPPGRLEVAGGFNLEISPYCPHRKKQGGLLTHPGKLELRLLAPALCCPSPHCWIYVFQSQTRNPKKRAKLAQRGVTSRTFRKV